MIVDPWDPQHADRVRVQGEILPTLRVYPSRLILKANSPVDQTGPSGTLSVLSRLPIRGISAVSEPEKPSPLAIGRPEFYDEGRRASFSIRLKTGEPIREGEFHIIIRQSPNAPERVVVPVLVQKGESR